MAPQIDVPLGDVPDYQPRETLVPGTEYLVDVDGVEVKEPKKDTTPGTVTHVAFLVTEGTTAEGRVLSAAEPFKIMDYFATHFDFAKSKLVRLLKSLGYAAEVITSGVDTEDMIGKTGKITVKNTAQKSQDGEAFERSEVKDYVYDK